MGKAYLEEVGKRIYKRRRQLKYTKKFLSQQTEIPVDMISRLERGNTVPFESLIKICEELDVSADYILSGNPGITETFRLIKNISELSEKDYEMVASMIEYFTTYPYENVK